MQAELYDMFRRNSRVAGVDLRLSGMPYLALPTTFSRSWIWQAIAKATGEQSHILTTPVADIALNPDDMARLGTISFA